MTLFRTFNPTLVDRIINHPTIRPTFEPGTFPLRSADVLADMRNVVFISTMGIFAFGFRGEGVYEGCAAQLPEARGKLALAEAKQALHAMFNEYRARRIEARVPRQLHASQMFIRLLGFERVALSDKYEHLALEV